MCDCASGGGGILLMLLADFGLTQGTPLLPHPGMVHLDQCRRQGAKKSP